MIRNLGHLAYDLLFSVLNLNLVFFFIVI